jgi:hypothetical protein
MPNTSFFNIPILLLALLLAGLLAASAKAETTEPGTLDIELNSLTSSKKGCAANFVMHNGLESAIDTLSLEIVLFGDGQRITRILKLKVGTLPVGKTSVKQFRLKSCDDISRILVNAISECDGTNLTPRNCLQKLRTKNRTTVQFGL